jgi:hypothetical protein
LRTSNGVSILLDDGIGLVIGDLEQQHRKWER